MPKKVGALRKMKILDTLKEKIPGTRQYRHRYERRIIERAKYRLKKRFDELQAIPPETKDRLRPSVRNYEVKLASLDIWDKTCENIFMIPLFIITLSILVISVYATKHLFSVNYSFWVLRLIYILSFLIWVISFLIAFLPFLVFKNKRFLKYLKVSHIVKFFWLGFFLCFYLSIIYRILSSYHNSAPNFLVYSLFCGLFVGYSLIMTMLLALFLFDFFRNLLVRPHRSIYPVAFLVDGLLQILIFLEKNPNKWMDLPFKRNLMSGIEKISTCIETDIVSQLSTSDTVTDYWSKQTFVRIASGIRSLKKWICTPKTDTYNQVTKFITSALINVVDGNWDSLPQAQPERVSKPQFISQMTVWLRVLITGIIPLVGLWIIQKTSLAFEGEILTYLRVGVYVWASLTFLTLFDPLIHEKMGAIKDILNILPGFKKEKNKE